MDHQYNWNMDWVNPENNDFNFEGNSHFDGGPFDLVLTAEELEIPGVQDEAIDRQSLAHEATMNGLNINYPTYNAT